MSISQKQFSQDPSFGEKKTLDSFENYFGIFSTEKIAKFIQTIQSKFLFARSCKESYNSCIKLLQAILIFTSKY